MEIPDQLYWELIKAEIIDYSSSSAMWFYWKTPFQPSKGIRKDWTDLKKLLRRKSFSFLYAHPVSEEWQWEEAKHFSAFDEFVAWAQKDYQERHRQSD